MYYRTGFGYDAHRLVKGRKLVLGGIDIQAEVGAEAHSDGDVLLHSIIDALFGALAIGDIGTHFPDNDSQYKDIDSTVLLRKAYDIIVEKGYEIVNIDSTVCLQAPKLSPYMDDMRQSIAEVLGVDIENVSVKATTTEKMGFVGTGEGIAAYAVVLLVNDSAQARLI